MFCILLSAGKAAERVLYLRQRKDGFQKLIYCLGSPLNTGTRLSTVPPMLQSSWVRFALFAFFVILLAVFQTGKPALLLSKSKFCPFFLQTELVE